MADWENPSNKNAKTLRIGIIPRVVCGASRVRTGDPLLAKSLYFRSRYLILQGFLATQVIACIPCASLSAKISRLTDWN